MPAQAAKANLISSLFGNDALAQNDSEVEISEPRLNSQNIELLAVNIPSASIFEYKTKENETEKEVTIADNALVPEMTPFAAAKSKPAGVKAMGGLDTDTSVYVIRKGDTISQIAEMYDVSVNTILWANGLKKGQKLVEGDVLFILPVDGVEITVKKGETLQSIAKKYKADVEEILEFNELESGAKLSIGDKLIVPDGEMFFSEIDGKTSSNLAASQIKDKNYYAANPIKEVPGYFANPLPTGRKTQGLHGPGLCGKKCGIDIGAPRGSNLYAAASGTVTTVNEGCVEGVRRCGAGYGNMVIISHNNGTKTLYGHMSKVLVRSGAKVSQGELIGLVGSTGHSTGPHVHFEVFGAKNPGADNSWAK